MSYEGREVPQGDPWGYRQFHNIADMGYGSRGPVYIMTVPRRSGTNT